MKDVLTLDEGERYEHGRILDPHLRNYDMGPDLCRVWSGCYLTDGARVLYTTDYRHYRTYRRVVANDGTYRDYLLAYPSGHDQISDNIKMYAVDKFVVPFPSPRWININRTAVFISKMNGRFWRKGIVPQQIAFSAAFQHLWGSLNIGMSSLLRFTGTPLVGLMKKILPGDRWFNPTYPSIDKAISSIKTADGVAVAISKEFCVALNPIDGNTYLLWETSVAGTVNLDTGAIELYPDFMWLDNSLTEVINNG